MTFRATWSLALNNFWWNCQLQKAHYLIRFQHVSNEQCLTRGCQAHNGCTSTKDSCIKILQIFMVSKYYKCGVLLIFAESKRKKAKRAERQLLLCVKNESKWASRRGQTSYHLFALASNSPQLFSLSDGHSDSLCGKNLPVLLVRSAWL